MLIEVVAALQRAEVLKGSGLSMHWKLAFISSHPSTVGTRHEITKLLND